MTMSLWDVANRAFGTPEAGLLDPSIAQQYRRFGQQQFGPTADRRLTEAYYGAAAPLMAQYYLAEPGMSANRGETGFSDFLSMYGGPTGQAYDPYGGGTARGLAEQAAFAARTTQDMWNKLGLAEGRLWDETDPFTHEQLASYTGMTPNERSLWRSTFGTGGEGFGDPVEAQNQLVQLLALQRGGLGAGTSMYAPGSRYGTAILNQLSGLREAQEMADPSTSFLDWYLDKTEGNRGYGWLG